MEVDARFEVRISTPWSQRWLVDVLGDSEHEEGIL